jgi:hypothetical protein
MKVSKLKTKLEELEVQGLGDCETCAWNDRKERYEIIDGAHLGELNEDRTYLRNNSNSPNVVEICF